MRRALGLSIAICRSLRDLLSVFPRPENSPSSLYHFQSPPVFKVQALPLHNAFSGYVTKGPTITLAHKNAGLEDL